jgi:hypothetical protein
VAGTAAGAETASAPRHLSQRGEELEMGAFGSNDWIAAGIKVGAGVLRAKCKGSGVGPACAAGDDIRLGQRQSWESLWHPLLKKQRPSLVVDEEDRLTGRLVDAGFKCRRAAFQRLHCGVLSPVVSSGRPRAATPTVTGRALDFPLA